MDDVLGNYIVWGGKNSLNYNIIVKKNPSLARATRKYTKVNVAGRNGDLFFFQNAWENYPQTYELFVGNGDENSTPLAMDKVSEWLAMDELHVPTYDDYINLTVNGYHQLVDSYEPNIIRLASLTEGYSTENLLGKFGNVNVTFNCRPERFTSNAFTPIVIEDAWISTINNPTSMTAKPNILIRCFESDTGIKVNDTLVNINYADSSTRILIDSELQDCYFEDLSNANNYVSLPNGFPTLVSGENTITVYEGIVSVEIVPRWWNL